MLDWIEAFIVKCNNIVMSDLKKLMNTTYVYPDPDDENFQKKILMKREFYGNKIHARDKMDTYANIKNYRDKVCVGPPQLLPQQAFLGNYVNLNTPYRGVLVFHGLGTGKCVLGSEYVLVNGIVMTMEELFIGYGEGEVFDGEGVWAEPRHELLINSYELGMMKLGKVKHLYRERIEQKVRKIVLSNGMELRVTKKHRLMVNGEWTEEIRVGDRVVEPKLCCFDRWENINLDVEQVVDNIGEYISDMITGGSIEVMELFVKLYLEKYGCVKGSRQFLMQFYYMLRMVGIGCRVGDGWLEIGGQEEVWIESVEEYEYDGYVYDLEVEDFLGQILNLWEFPS